MAQILTFPVSHEARARTVEASIDAAQQGGPLTEAQAEFDRMLTFQADVQRQAAAYFASQTAAIPAATAPTEAEIVYFTALRA